ncbi:MAG: cyclic nucleotide-binding domain-containing protein [Pleurocapsa sp. SU_5_0]|nr:cyclic nucleotide-binding domain-containing protein [Pleurocapsa sp. SU_5_0]NJR47701.1 cyclic nucleotide-binding domain-containing protein [Hyellaceae cyanobacterium CSU_1_1]
MDSRLKYLTIEDYGVLLEQAQVATYKQHDVILKEGRLSQAIYLVRQGTVRIERAATGRDVAIAFLEPGEVFGEVSFLEGVPTTDAVIAQEDVEIFVINQAQLAGLLDTQPGLSDRFYQSLVHNLSSRLHQTSSLVSHLMRRVRIAPEYYGYRTGQTGQNEIPPELVSETELFKKNLSSIEQLIRHREINELDAQIQIDKICNMLISTLREQIIEEPEIAQAIGTFIFRETFPFFMLSSFLDRAFRRPGGYFSDSYITELLSQNEPEGDSYLGIYLDRWIRSRPTCLALKHRGGIITETIKHLIHSWTESTPLPIASIASGSASEILNLYFQAEPPNVHVTCVDFNHQEISSAASIAHKWGFQDHLTFVQDNFFLMAEGYSQIDIPPQKMIYSVSMANCLCDREFIRILDWIYDHLLPDGIVVLANLHAANPDRILLEHILEWHSIYRLAKDLESLFSRSKFRSLPLSIQSDEYGVELFVICKKAWVNNQQ